MGHKGTKETRRRRAISRGLRERREKMKLRDVFECIKKDMSVFEISTQCGLDVAEVKRLISKLAKIQHVHEGDLGEIVGGILGRVGGTALGAEVGGPAGGAVGGQLGATVGAEAGKAIEKALRKK